MVGPSRLAEKRAPLPSLVLAALPSGCIPSSLGSPSPPSGLLEGCREEEAQPSTQVRPGFLR